MPTLTNCLPAFAAIGVFALAITLACAPDGKISAPHDPMTINRIAYIASDGQLVTVNPDGSDRRVLTTGAVADATGRIGGVVAQPMQETRLYGWPVWVARRKSNRGVAD